jgi:uncharacterized membrane protein
MQATLPSPTQPIIPAPPAVGDINVRDPERIASAMAGGALAAYGLRRASARLPALLAGGYLLYRGLSGHCPLYASLDINAAGTATRPSHVEHTITMAASPSEIYRLWRDFANLPSFMHNLEEVQVLDERRSRWVARGPVGARVSWDAEIFLERENELIAWRSLPEAQIVNAGSVHFAPAPGDRGTEVRVVLEYLPPAGNLGRIAARMFGAEPDQQVIDDLRRLKMIVEAGEVATNAMRPARSAKEHN